jgi:hypothetical protein
MCEHALDQWRRRAELESFNNSILKEIEEARLRLERRIVDLRIQGNFHEVAKCEKLVALLNRTEESMRRMGIR